MDPSAAGLSPVQVEAVAHLKAAFERAKIKYAIIGGLAVGFRSRPRSTADVDVLLDVPQIVLPGLLEDLTARGFTLDERDVIDGFVHHSITAFDYRGIRIDWLKPMLPVYHHVLDRAESIPGLDELPIRVATAEGLVVLKIMAARPQDDADIAAILASNRGQLDLAWIEQECLTIFETSDRRWQRYQEMIGKFYER